MIKSTNIIFAVLILVWFIMSGIVFLDRASVLKSAQSKDATIMSCDERISYRSARSAKGGAGLKRWTYAPIAVSAEGYKVTGKIYVSERKNCEQMIGRQVKILVDQHNPDNARINSFLQFWMYPIALAFVGAMTLAIILVAKGVFVILFMSGALILGGGAFHELKGFGKPNAPTPPIVIDNDGAWAVCLAEARRKEGVIRDEHLKRLTCDDRGLTDLLPLQYLPNLEYLDIRSNQITSLSAIAHLRSLRELTLSNNKSLQTLDGLDGLPSLEILKVRGVPLDDISALATVTSLRDVDLTYNGLQDISALSDLTNLEIVNLDDNQELDDISALANKPNLEVVTLYRTQTADLSPLFSSPKLQRINLGRNSPVPCTQIHHLQDNTSQTIRGMSEQAQCN